jgi:hypothetical protein
MRLIPVLTIALLLLSFTAMQAQETFQPKQLDDPAKGIVYNKEFAVGLRMHTNGFSLGVNLGEIKTYYRTRYWHFEIGELQHPKEFRQSFDTPSTVNGRISRAFKYGKENSLLVLRAAIGEKRYFSEKAKYKGVAVGLSYEAGATLGMLKPYYLELRAGDGRASITTKYSETTAARFLDIWQIQGASSWSEGLGELSLVPGAHLKAAVHFDWGAYDAYLKSIEAGVMVDAFARETPIMVETSPSVENKQLFINLFLHLQFGKRW